MNKPKMVWSNGVVFIGILGAACINGTILDRAVIFSQQMVMTPQGAALATQMQKIEGLVLGNNFTYADLPTNDEVYQKYIEVTSGIKIPLNKMSM